MCSGAQKCRRHLHRHVAAPARPQKAVSAAHVAHPSMTHRVAADETLWDLSLRYGVTMKSIRAVNGIPQTSDVIRPGQVLTLPIQALDKKAGSGPLRWIGESASGKAVDPSVTADAPKVETQQSTEGASEPIDEWLWAGPDAVVQHTTVEELNNIMTQPEGTPLSEQDTVVVAYMPDCRHCRDIEPVVRSTSPIGTV